MSQTALDAVCQLVCQLYANWCATAVTVPEPAILPVHVGAADAPPPLMPKPSEELPSLRPLDLSGA